MIELLLVGISGFALGVAFISALQSRRPKTKYPCPWSPCGYPLPETPLTIKPETATHHGSYAPEECDGCGETVLWSEFAKNYVRVKAK